MNTLRGMNIKKTSNGMSIPVIGVCTPRQVADLQAATGMVVAIGRNGMKLVQSTAFKSLLDPYEQVERDAWLGQMGAFPGGAA